MCAQALRQGMALVAMSSVKKDYRPIIGKGYASSEYWDASRQQVDLTMPSVFRAAALLSDSVSFVHVSRQCPLGVSNIDWQCLSSQIMIALYVCLDVVIDASSALCCGHVCSVYSAASVWPCCAIGLAQKRI